LPIQILLADDHNLLAEAVSNMLNAQPDSETITTDSLRGVLSVLDANPEIDIVLLDLKMPGMVGLESVKTVIERSGKAKVLLFTGMVDRHFLNSAIDLGCRGLIPKTMALQSVSSVINLVMSGQLFVPMELAQANNDPGSENHGLTEKELFVLRLAADGLTNKEIARDMNSSEVTIKMHMRSICKKLNARNRAHAAMISRERAII